MNTFRYYNLLPLFTPAIRPPSVSLLQKTTRYMLYTGEKTRPLSTLPTSSNMATATRIHLSPMTDTGIYSFNVREDSAQTASQILQEDMEKHHVFFNNQGFHSKLIPFFIRLLFIDMIKIIFLIKSSVYTLSGQAPKISRLVTSVTKVIRDPRCQLIAM